MLRNAALCCLFSITLSLPAATSRAAERIDLSRRPSESTVKKVTIALEAGGHSLVRADAQGKNPAADQKLPMSVSAQLQYDERIISSPAGQERGPLAIRYYEKAEAVLKVDDAGRTPRLADDRRLIAVEDSGSYSSLYSLAGSLPREQLDLIEVVGNTCYVDGLLPTEPVANGDSWDLSAAVMGPFLALDSVAVCEVKGVLDEFNSSFAKIRLAGVVHGVADGAATEMDVRALYLFDRKLGCVTRLNLAIREKRSIGAATPGLEAVAKLQITMEPISSSAHLSDEVAKQARSAARNAMGDVLCEAAALGFRVRHDRKWFVTGEGRESLTLRRVDRGDLIAQCTLTALPPKSAGRQTSLEQFQKDVTYSLGKSFGELVSSRQWQNAAGHYCYELVARGVVEEVPVEWHHYLIAPESGHRVSLGVTIEKPMVDRLEQADRALVESLELFPRMPAAQTAVREPTNGPSTK